MYQPKIRINTCMETKKSICKIQPDRPDFSLRQGKNSFYFTMFLPG